MPTPPRDQWVADFAHALMLLRPGIGLRFANTIAHSEWVKSKGVEAGVAAKRWVAGSAKPK